jgi:hypothetical protein
MILGREMQRRLLEESSFHGRIHAAISDLVPPRIYFEGGSMEVPPAELFPSELKMMQRSARKRLSEFTAGRFYARRALGVLGRRPAPIVSNSNQAPIWPPGIVGSISHCEQFCGAMVARTGDILALGLTSKIALLLISALFP